jgi:hypothetical protein
MKKINRNKIKIKNLIGIVDDPVHEDLLFEIVDFLESESRQDGVFKKAEVGLKTRCRINAEIVEDLETLCELKYIEKLKYSEFKVLKHPW